MVKHPLTTHKVAFTVLILDRERPKIWNLDKHTRVETRFVLRIKSIVIGPETIKLRMFECLGTPFEKELPLTTEKKKKSASIDWSIQTILAISTLGSLPGVWAWVCHVAQGWDSMLLGGWEDLGALFLG
jgi:hypothetical protein